MEKTIWREKKKKDRELRNDIMEVNKMERSVIDRMEDLDQVKEDM